MAKKSKADVQDEAGAEARFLRGIRKALKTPHKPHKDGARQDGPAARLKKPKK